MIKDRQVKMVKDGQAKMVNHMDTQRWSMTWTSKDGQWNGQAKRGNDMDKQRGATKWRRKDGQRWTSEDGTPVAEYD